MAIHESQYNYGRFNASSLLSEASEFKPKSESSAKPKPEALKHTRPPESISQRAMQVLATLPSSYQMHETRKTYPHADQVTVRSGRVVTVFNICGNDFRLITAIHYDRQKVFILNFLTHAEYSRSSWKDRL